MLDADGVAIENITVQNYKVNGFYWSGVDGYRGSYLTSVRNGDYGIFGVRTPSTVSLDHSYAVRAVPTPASTSGSASSATLLIVDVEAEWNGLGYSGTNAGGIAHHVVELPRQPRRDRAEQRHR